jgi:hypothetical protein
MPEMLTQSCPLRIHTPTVICADTRAIVVLMLVYFLIRRFFGITAVLPTFVTATLRNHLAVAGTLMEHLPIRCIFTHILIGRSVRLIRWTLRHLIRWCTRRRSRSRRRTLSRRRTGSTATRWARAATRRMIRKDGGQTYTFHILSQPAVPASGPRFLLRLPGALWSEFRILGTSYLFYSELSISPPDTTTDRPIGCRSYGWRRRVL